MEITKSELLEAKFNEIKAYKEKIEVELKKAQLEYDIYYLFEMKYKEDKNPQNMSSEEFVEFRENITNTVSLLCESSKLGYTGHTSIQFRAIASLALRMMLGLESQSFEWDLEKKKEQEQNKE